MNESHSSSPSRTDWDRLRAMPDEEVDTSDIPPARPEALKRATVRLPRPRPGMALMEVPVELVPAVKELLARHNRG